MPVDQVILERLDERDVKNTCAAFVWVILINQLFQNRALRVNHEVLISSIEGLFKPSSIWEHVVTEVVETRFNGGVG